MCGSMAEIQSVTAEIRRGEKEEETTEHKQYKCSAIAEMGNHLATIDMDRKFERLCPFRGSWVSI